MGRRQLHAGFWWRNLGEGDHLEDQGVDERIILRWILVWRHGLKRSGSEQEQVVGCCECGNEPSGSF
jgi:hypothetical protein